jgi:hypothetical protein
MFDRAFDVRVLEWSFRGFRLSVRFSIQDVRFSIQMECVCHCTSNGWDGIICDFLKGGSQVLDPEKFTGHTTQHNKSIFAEVEDSDALLTRYREPN